MLLPHNKLQPNAEQQDDYNMRGTPASFVGLIRSQSRSPLVLHHIRMSMKDMTPPVCWSHVFKQVVSRMLKCACYRGGGHEGDPETGAVASPQIWSGCGMRLSLHPQLNEPLFHTGSSRKADTSTHCLKRLICQPIQLKLTTQLF